MENIPKKGFAYINEFLIKKENPSSDAELVGILGKGETIHYEGVEQNKFGIWLILIEDDKKKYILIKDKENKYYANLPNISDGKYLIQSARDNEVVLEIDDNGIITNEINIDDKQKFLFVFIPEDNCYRIISISSNNSFEINEEDGNKLNQCEIFSEKEIKWKINTNDFKYFYLQDEKTKLVLEYSVENKNIILSEFKPNNENQKFILVSLEDDIQNKDNEKNIDKKNNNLNVINEEENKIIDDEDKKNEEEKINISDEEKENKSEDENEENENEENENEENENEENENEEINDIIENDEINMEKNEEVKQILDSKPNENSLKFLNPKFIITKEDIYYVGNKEKIKHIEIDLSVEEIEENIFEDFKNLESVYCHPKWLNRLNPKNLKEIYIKEGVTKIEKEDFKLCFKLNVIYLPYSIKKIENNSFENWYLKEHKF